MEAKFFVREVFYITGIGAVPVGSVNEGILRVGMKANVNEREMEIKSIEMNHKQIPEAKKGDNIGISLRNGDYQLLKGLVNTEIVFSGEGIAPQNVQNTVKPEGAFSFLKKIFQKK